MIRTVADLLNEIVKIEKEFLNGEKMKHPSTIGNMYEGLTEAILEISIDEKINLRISKNSFIKGSEKEYDILLVEGEGEQIPYTDQFKFRINQVIAIIQVKKNIYSKDLKDGFENLNNLLELVQPYDSEYYVTKIFKDAFRGTCRKDITSKKKNELSIEEEYIYHTLRLEAIMPLRIILGYNGFKSEYSFREYFINYFELNLTKDYENPIIGFSPISFPNLIISENFSMIKNNGMPFSVPINKDQWWDFYTTSAANPILFLLEIIWTRLSYNILTWKLIISVTT